MTKTNFESQRDTEILDEYDFSTGVRGKYYQHYQNNNLPSLKGIQLLRDRQNRKTGVLIDLQTQQNLWDTVSPKYDYLSNIQFLTDNQGHKIAVFLNFQEHLSLWQELYDCLIADLID